MEIPNKLVTQINTGNVVPFIGAGFSIYFGYPGWTNLLYEIAQDMGLSDLKKKDIKKADPLQMAQALFEAYKNIYFEEAAGEVISNLGINDFKQGDVTTLNEELGLVVTEKAELELEESFSRYVLSFVKINEANIQKTETEKLRKIKELPFRQLLTTNYDSVLEDIFGNEHIVVAPESGEELIWDERESGIIKVHGDRKTPGGVIFTHSQYYKFMQDFGYFRSKLYTVFSNSVVLMMGYGFSDITVHQTYFQFIRDYASKIKEGKFYMVLTNYDKNNWGSYYDYYVSFLESYKITVIHATYLPDFVEQLANDVKHEKNITDLKEIFDYEEERHVDAFNKSILYAVKKGEKLPNISLRESTAHSLIRAIVKIFKGPYELSKPPFEIPIEEADLPINIGLNLLDYSIILIQEFHSLTESGTFLDLTNEALRYTTVTGDFFGLSHRLERFIILSSKLKKSSIETEVGLGEYIYDILDRSHPSKYLKSFPAGDLLKKRVHEISEFHLMSYFSYVKELLIEYSVISDTNSYWIEHLSKNNEKLSMPLQTQLTKVNELVEENREN